MVEDEMFKKRNGKLYCDMLDSFFKKEIMLGGLYS